MPTMIGMQLKCDINLNLPLSVTNNRVITTATGGSYYCVGDTWAFILDSCRNIYLLNSILIYN